MNELGGDSSTAISMSSSLGALRESRNLRAVGGPPSFPRPHRCANNLSRTLNISQSHSGNHIGCNSLNSRSRVSLCQGRHQPPATRNVTPLLRVGVDRSSSNNRRSHGFSPITFFIRQCCTSSW